MPITKPQAVSANANNVALSSTTLNDVILVFAYNSGSTTIPSLPAGFTSIDTSAAGGSSNAARSGWKYASAGETTSGTWTNATSVEAEVYRGTNLTNPIGGHTPTTGNSSTINYGALAMSAANGSSWVTGFGGSKSATAGMGSSTSLLTNVTSQTTVNALSSEGGLSAYAGESLTATSGARYVTHVVEILAPFQATLATTDAADVSAAAASATTGAALTSTDTQDAQAVGAANWTTAGIAATDGADVSAVTGVPIIPLVLTGGFGVAGGAVDARTVSGGFVSPVVATLNATIAATDAKDTQAVGATNWTTAGIAATDGADVAALAVARWTTAGIAATDGADVAAQAVTVTTGTTLAATDAPDTLAVAAQNWTAAQVAASDAADTQAAAVTATTGAALALADAQDSTAVTAETGQTSVVIASTDAANTHAVATTVTTGAGLALVDGADILTLVGANWTTTQIVFIDGHDTTSVGGAATTPASVAAVDAADIYALLMANWTTSQIAVVDGASLTSIATTVRTGAALSLADAADQLALSVSLPGVFRPDRMLALFG